MHDIAEQIHHQLQIWQKERSACIPEQAKQIIVAAVSPSYSRSLLALLRFFRGMIAGVRPLCV
jgi:hypothetical protein